MTPLESALLLTGLAAEAAIVAVVLVKRVFHTFPVFCSYLIWSLINDAGATALEHFFPGSADHIYLSATIIDSLFQFAVLVELSMSVLKPAPRFAAARGYCRCRADYCSDVCGRVALCQDSRV